MATPASGLGQVSVDVSSLPMASPLVDPGAGRPADRTWDLGELVAGQSYGGEIRPVQRPSSSSWTAPLCRPYLRRGTGAACSAASRSTGAHSW